MAAALEPDARSAAARHPFAILIALSLGVMVSNAFGRFAYGLILPAMRADLAWSYTEAGWMNTANAIGYIAGAALTLWLIRRVEPSRLFSAGLAATTLALIASALTADFWALTVWRAAAGVSGALVFICGGRLAAALFPDSASKNALAIALYYSGGGGLGLVAAGAALPFYFDAFGPAAWPGAWGALGAVSALTCALALPAAFAMRMAPPQAAPRGRRAALPVAAMAPEIAGYVCMAFGYIIYLTFLSATLRADGLATPLVAGAWVAVGLSVAVSPFLWRGVLARFRGGTALALSNLFAAVGAALPLLAGGAVATLLSAAVFGLAIFAGPSAITVFARRNLPAADWGAAIGLFTVLFAIGQALGPIAAGIQGDVTGSIRYALVVAAGALLTGALVAAVQRPLHLHAQPGPSP